MNLQFRGEFVNIFNRTLSAEPRHGQSAERDRCIIRQGILTSGFGVMARLPGSEHFEHFHGPDRDVGDEVFVLNAYSRGQSGWKGNKESPV